MILARFAIVARPLLLAAQQPTSVQPAGSNPQVQNPQPTKPEDKCTIEGQVLSLPTGEPVKKAQITLQSMSAEKRSGYSAVADASGHYVLQDIDPGQYRLSAVRNGFVAEQYGARGTGQGGAPLTLNPGQHMSDISFRLVPHGVITGRVLDEDGEPVQHVQVSTMRYRFVNGKRQLAPAGGGTGTNNLGEYRIFGLAPGK